MGTESLSNTQGGAEEGQVERVSENDIFFTTENGAKSGLDVFMHHVPSWTRVVCGADDCGMSWRLFENIY